MKICMTRRSRVSLPRSEIFWMRWQGRYRSSLTNPIVCDTGLVGFPRFTAPCADCLNEGMWSPSSAVTQLATRSLRDTFARCRLPDVIRFTDSALTRHAQGVCFYLTAALRACGACPAEEKRRRRRLKANSGILTFHCRTTTTNYD